MTDSVVRAETVADLLAQSRSTIIDAAGNERTPAQVLARGRALGARFAAAGLSPGDRVAVQLPNGDLYLDLLAACASYRFTLMAVNLRFGDALAESLIERSGASMVIRSPHDLPPELPEPPADAASTAASGAPGPDDRFAIFTTSGTTSQPKLVVHTQRSVAVHAGDAAAHVGYDRDAVVLIPLPLCGVFGFTVLWAALAGHATVVLPNSFDADETARLIGEHRVTSMHGTDDMFHRMLATDHDLSSLNQCGYAQFNSALESLVERCAARGVPLSGIYGMSEVQALFAYRGTLDLADEARSVAGGQLVSPNAECRVVDGELQVRGPSLFDGYLADGGASIDAELTANAFDGDWFATGDLAVDQGLAMFDYVARMGDVMRLGGFLVAPTEIEDVLVELDAIDQAQVVAAARTMGARPVAFVIAAPGSAIDEAAVIDHCRQRLARYKCPVRVVELDSFPVTDGPNGVKVQRSVLRAEATALVAEDRSDTPRDTAR